jgi:hypothetical protein
MKWAILKATPVAIRMQLVVDLVQLYARRRQSGSVDQGARWPVIGAWHGPISQLMVRSSATLVKRAPAPTSPYPLS